jgi:flagellar export protein FliJ
LGSLFRLARAHESLQRQELAAREAELLDVERRRSAHADRDRDAIATFHRLCRSGASPRELIGALDYAEQCGRRGEALAGEAAERRGRADAARERLAARNAERRSFERLRDRQLKRHDRESERRLQRDADDLLRPRRGELQ